MIEGWAYSSTGYTTGGSLTDNNGDTQTIAQDGGWVDFEVAIPDSHTEVRIRIEATNAPVLRHDAALWQVRLFSGPVNVPAAVTMNTPVQTIDAGASVVLDITAGGNSPLAYLWSANGGTFTSTAAQNPTWNAPSPTNQTGYTLTVVVTDDDNETATASVIVTVRAAPIIDTNPTVSISTPTGQTVDAGTAFPVASTQGTGGDSDILTGAWSATPAGGAFAAVSASNTTFTASPSEETEYTLTRTVEDSDSNTVTDSITVTVRSADSMPTAPTIPDRAGTVGTAFSYTLPLATGGDLPVTATADQLPAGLSLTNGVISGTPTAAGTTTVTITYTDTDGDSDTAQFDFVTSATGTATGTADLWVIDSSGDDLWRIDPLDPGRVTDGYGRVGAFPTALTTATGITSHDDDLWVIDDAGDELWRINPANPSDVSGVYGLVGDFDSALTSPQGLTSLDGDLWVAATSGGDELWRINPANPSDTSGVYGDQGRFATGLQFPLSLTSHDGDLWASDNTGDELWRINPANPLSSSGVYGEVGSFAGGISTPTGLTSLAGDLWVADTTGDELWRVNPVNPSDVSGVYGNQGIFPAGLGNPTGMTAHSLNAPPTVTFNAPTSPVDGGATQTISGSFSDPEGNATATVTVAATRGTISNVAKNNGAGTWSATWVAPARTGAAQTATITATATDDLGLTDTASRNVTIRAIVVPDEPGAPSVTSTGTTSISATFSAANTGDAAVTLDLRWREGTTGSWTEIIGVNSPRSITGLTDGALHQVAVRGVNIAGNGAWSDPPGSATTDTADLMPTIGVVAGSDVEQGTALSRTLPAATGGDLPVTYTVTGRPSDMTFNSATRVLAWPAQTSPSSHDLTYTAEDTDGDQATRIFTVRALLALSDFVAPAGTLIACSGLFTSGVPTLSGGVERLWGRAPRTAWGALTDGNFTFDGVSINEIRRAGDGSNFRLLKNGGTGFNAYFAVGGDGENARFYILTEAITIEFDAVANILTPSGGNFFNFALPNTAGWRSALNSIDDGDRFIMGWTIPSVAVHPLRASLALPAPGLSARVSRVLPVVRGLRASLALPAPSFSARANRGRPFLRGLRASVALPAPSFTARLSRAVGNVFKLRAALTLPAPGLSARVSRFVPDVRKLRASVALPAPSFIARVSRIVKDSLKLRAALTLPAPGLSARVSRFVPDVRKLRASVALPAPSFIARVSTFGVNTRRLRASLAFPAPGLSARVSRFVPFVRKLRASVALPAPSFIARVSRIVTGSLKLRAALTLPAPGLSARVSRFVPFVRKLRGPVAIPAPSFTARVSRLVTNARKLRAALALPTPSFFARVSQLMLDENPPAIPPAPSPRAVSHSGVLVYYSGPSTGPDVTDFDLRYRVFDAPLWVTLSGVGLVSPYARSGLSPNTIYEWQVRAVNFNGPGFWSVSEFTRTAPALDVTRHSDLLISQYAESTRMHTLFRGIVGVFQAELVSALLSLSDFLVLDLAPGVWLDHFGVRLGLTRPLRLISGVRFFGFGMALDRAGFDGAPFRSVRPDLTNQVQIGDNWYRSLLKGQALKLRLGDSVPDIEAVCAVVFDGGGYVSENTGNLAMTIHVVDSREGFVTVASNAGVLPSPAGISVTISTS